LVPRVPERGWPVEATPCNQQADDPASIPAARQFFVEGSTLFVAPVLLAGLVLSPLAVIAALMGAWRLGSDAGWTSDFFIAGGLLSRYQLWFAIAIGAQASVLILNSWVANQNVSMPAPPLSPTYSMTPAELGQLRPPVVT
jgi:hypothetical protein